jgi:hypothetical protein
VGKAAGWDSLESLKTAYQQSYPRKLWNEAEVGEGLRDMKKAAYPSV